MLRRPHTTPSLLIATGMALLAPVLTLSAPAPAASATTPTAPAAQSGADPVPPGNAATATPATTAILLDLSQRDIALLRDGKAVRRWPVAIGAPETPTPVGRFQVQTMVVNPVYQSTSSGQVKGVGALGYRWIGFHNQGPNVFGIHGTPWPQWVHQRAAVSHGCVRMLNADIEQLFAAVAIGTPVVIQP